MFAFINLIITFICIMLHSYITLFSAWYESMSPGKSVTQLTKVELAEVIKNFYMTTRKKDGNPYKLCSYLAIRRCLSLIFQYDYGLMHVDISCDPEFLDANVVFSQMSHSLRGREENFGVTESWRLTPEKLKKLYTEGQLDFYNTQNPKILLQTVYFFVCYYTGIGKLSVMRQIVTNDISEVLENGRLIAYNLDLRKYLPTEKGCGPFTIYEIQGKPWCPVLTIREYLSHRNKSVQSFFQKPLSRAQCFGSSVWFKRSRFKDVYPLANMCREAHIDPPLTSGCFTKSRISAEIRYEMSFVYAKLFPQCFSSNEEVQQKMKLNAVKKKRARKQMPARPNFNTRGCPSSAGQASNNPVPNQRNSTTVAQSVNQMGYDLSEDMTTPPSMVVSRSFNSDLAFRQSTSQATYRESYDQLTVSNSAQLVPRSQINQLDTSGNVNILQPSEIPSISVTNVFSCRRDAVGSNNKQPDAVKHFMMQSTQAAPPNQSDSDSKKEVVFSKDSIVQLEAKTPNDVISLDDEDDSPSGHCQEVIPSNDHSFTGESTHISQSSSYSYTEASCTVHPSINGTVTNNPPSQRPSNSDRCEPQSKRSRFDMSSHTFLREISASAREQGKGAVMLLLSLLDDLSNNRGKELLKDILQEMKVI